MENVVWGAVPAQRTRKQEKYSTPVVTMSAIDKPGAGRKFSFNKAAQALLGIEGEDRVSFGFVDNGKRIFIRKVKGDEGFQLTKTCTLSDKRTYEFIAKTLGLSSEVENEFNLAMVEGQNYAEMTLKETKSEAPVIEFERPAEIGTLDAEADHDVEDIAEYIPMDEVGELEEEVAHILQPEAVEVAADEAPFDTEEAEEEDEW